MAKHYQLELAVNGTRNFVSSGVIVTASRASRAIQQGGKLFPGREVRAKLTLNKAPVIDLDGKKRFHRACTAWTNQTCLCDICVERSQKRFHENHSETAPASENW